MSGTASEEHSNLYKRGVSEAASGMELKAQDVLDVLVMFGEDGVRSYLIGILQRLAMMLTHATSLFRLLHSIADHCVSRRVF